MGRAGNWAGLVGLLLLSVFAAVGVSAERLPNIVLVLVDDMGWSDPGFLGGDIKTPHIDRLAREGMFFPRFFNHAKCEPTRASLMTGVHFHRQTRDHVTRKFRDVTTIAGALKRAGYFTVCAGKWHLPDQPTDHGFDRFFGLLMGAANHFDPDGRLGLDERFYAQKEFAFNGEPISITDEDFYSTDAFTDYALQFLQEGPEDSPSFLYLAYTAPHWPLQAPEATIQKYEGRYAAGWDRLRAQRHEHLMERRVLPADFPRAPRDPAVPAWDVLTPDQQLDAARCMAVHAAMVDRLDQQIGRVIEFFEKQGVLDNTLILFASDNGVSAETRFNRTPEIPAGSVESFRTLPLGFCNAVNTPFQKYKCWNANGGICSPFIAFWPGRIAEGGIEHQPINILDIMPTLLEVADVPYPETLRPLDGQSILPLLTGQPAADSETMFFQLKYAKSVDQKAVIQWPWKAWYNGDQGWSLYRLDGDLAETTDLKTGHPHQLKTLIEAYRTFDAAARKDQQRP